MTSGKPHYENVPYEIPESWEWVYGFEIFNPMQSTKPEGDFFDYIDIDAIDNKRNVIIAPKHLALKDAPSRATRQVSKGDILFSMVRPYLRNIAKVDKDNYIASTGFYVCKPNDSITNDYCLYLMLSDYVVSGLNQFMKGDNSPSINNDHILSWQYPLPPIKEQQRIVAYIEKLFTIIDVIETGKQELQYAIKQVKSKILDLAIQGKLVPQKSTDEPAIDLLNKINPQFVPCDTSHYENIPHNWCVCKLKDIFEITMGSSPTGDSLNRLKEGVEFHQGKICFTDKYLSKSDIFTNSLTKTGKKYSILLCVRAPVGLVNITERDICIGRGLCALYPKQCLDLMFAFYALQTYQDYFDEKATGSTFKAIGGDTIREAEFLLPPYNEQKRIRKALENIFANMDEICKEL